MSSPVSINLGAFKSLVSLNHYPWLVMWFEVPKSTYQTYSKHIWYNFSHWICHVLHHKELFITSIASWCIIPLLQLSIMCIMFPLRTIFYHVFRFPTIITVCVFIWLLTLMISNMTSMTSSSSKVFSCTSMNLTFMLMMSTMWAFVLTSRWGFTTSISISIWIEGTLLQSSIWWSTNNSHLFIYK